MRNKIILVTGGARSGKSLFAQRLAGSLSRRWRDVATRERAPSKSVYFVATAAAFDDEMRRRIQLHKKNRPKSWKVIEAPTEAAEAINSLDGKCGVLVIDCLTLFVSNLFLRGVDERMIELKGKKILKAINSSKMDAVVVTNELGMGIVPEKPLSRKFRDIHGRVNQLFADSADEAYLMISGLPVRLK